MRKINWNTILVIVSLPLVVGVFLVGYNLAVNLTANPEAIQAQALLAEKTAVEWQAKQDYYQQLPTIYKSFGEMALFLLVGIGAFVLLLSVAVSAALMSFRAFVNNGMQVNKFNKLDGESRFSLSGGSSPTPIKVPAIGSGLPGKVGHAPVVPEIDVLGPVPLPSTMKKDEPIQGELPFTFPNQSRNKPYKFERF